MHTYIFYSGRRRRQMVFRLYLTLCFSLQFTGLSVTSGVDQMVALHTSSQDDILLCVQRGELCPNQDRVGELVGTLVDHFTRSVPQPDTKQTSPILSCGFLLCRLWNGQRETSFQGHHTLWFRISLRKDTSESTQSLLPHLWWCDLETTLKLKKKIHLNSSTVWHSEKTIDRVHCFSVSGFLVCK